MKARSSKSHPRTIHLVFNAHLDPVWLWPWSAGLDEIVNTCETTCAILERHPDVIFTRGEAWVYAMIEKLHPALFRRIKGLIKRGQWEVIGGWWVQPDCNLPSGFALEKQIALGKEYFENAFGHFPGIAYNVDSFGHSAALPGLMAAAGQTHYVMMRPMEDEKTLPARLFRWRGRKGEKEIVTFRVPPYYCTPVEITLAHLEASLTALPEGVSHTMCFVGVGDHGGGPTEEMIAFCRANRDAIPGARLEFSSPSRFFAAVEKQKPSLPLVTGEMQMHAIGCYSVHRSVKLDVRRAEHLLAQAENALGQDATLEKEHRRSMEDAWRWTCFHHFHDTLCGTCIPGAYGQVDAQLGFGKAVADEVLQYALRRKSAQLPPASRQRLVLGNYSGADFDGWIEHEPWLEWTKWQPGWSLVDEKGKTVPHQVIHEARHDAGHLVRLLFRIRIKCGARPVLHIGTPLKGVPPPAPAPGLTVGKMPGGTLSLRHGDQDWPAPTLQLAEDLSDTWSHGLHSFEGKIAGEAKWGKPRQINSGPLLNAWHIGGQIGKSPLEAEWRAYAGEDFLELRLRVTWLETFRILRLAWQPGAGITSREDGISGGSLRRECDGREYNVHDWTLLNLADGRKAGVVLPDTYSLSGTGEELRLTLLRSCIMAHDIPGIPGPGRRTVSDHGVQAFLFRFHPAGTASAAKMARHALGLHRPPLVSDLTRGMPWRPTRNQIERPLR
ncbi:MAG: hypothetical protein WC003_08185 [Terrimicrobiaceae bacterium]